MRRPRLVRNCSAPRQALNADRNHPRKKNRPFAAGKLSARSGVLAAMILILASSAIAIFVGWKFCAVLAGYYILTWSYSLRLKRAALVDVMGAWTRYWFEIVELPGQGGNHA